MTTDAPARDLAGRCAVVTGGSRGIGRAVVLALAARGCDVVIASRKESACADLAAEVTSEHGVRALPVGMNVSSWDDCDRLAATALETFGDVDILVNNAGLSPLYDDLTSVTADLFDKVINVNLRGPFRLTALLGGAMAAGRGGSIVNIGSSAAVRPVPAALPYSAAKAGLHVLTEGFAQALAPKVRVNTVHPGPILSDIATHWREGEQERLAASVALGRCGTVEEVVGAVVYFATDVSGYTTGAVLRVDGGLP
ncbi:glucose 1-dehydrogenase [Nakamurella sp. YIM 132087]|uniref:Glucose 1-dehydrogenase n=1 Tax=Nakamurella alba TaxID=2665158 RepID=A0A7K1FPB5_9ACTN|nr:glucose 1-dehydrogenase [Nakamurella alba]MTD15992.1 glucose 1-dehydrogenase [Nakamurella alba]